LLVGIKALPLSTAQHIPIGITSLSKMGHFGACLEVILILYLWIASVVGLYTLPVLNRLRPKLRDTSFTQIVGNCALLLVLSSALPLLARTVGITNFDLLGDFGRIEWLGNFYVVLFYNLVFLVTTALSLTNKFTASVRRELYKRLKALINWFRWPNETETTSKVLSVNGKNTMH
ncbi:limb region 1 protein-like protein, partial [Leptotrombidium deliense]